MVVLRKNTNFNDEISQEIQPKIRKDFPETWLFEDFSPQENDTTEYVKNLP